MDERKQMSAGTAILVGLCKSGLGGLVAALTAAAKIGGQQADAPPHTRPHCCMSRAGGCDMADDRIDELASDVDDALVSADELQDDPGETKPKTIAQAKGALQKAKTAVDKMEDATGRKDS